MARQGQLLAEQRLEHLQALQRSGRWRHYCTEDELMTLMRKVAREVEGWTSLAARTETAELERAE